MKYVLLGKLNLQWLTRTGHRVDAAKKKLGALGIKLESFHYTQGPYDFVDVVESTDPLAMLAFSLWYAEQGFGSITTMPAFGTAEMDAAVNRMKA